MAFKECRSFVQDCDGSNQTCSYRNMSLTSGLNQEYQDCLEPSNYQNPEDSNKTKKSTGRFFLNGRKSRFGLWWKKQGSRNGDVFLWLSRKVNCKSIFLVPFRVLGRNWEKKRQLSSEVVFRKATAFGWGCNGTNQAYSNADKWVWKQEKVKEKLLIWISRSVGIVVKRSQKKFRSNSALFVTTFVLSTENFKKEIGF